MIFVITILLLHIKCSLACIWARKSKDYYIVEEINPSYMDKEFQLQFSNLYEGKSAHAETIKNYLISDQHDQNIQEIIKRVGIPEAFKCGITKKALINPIRISLSHSIIYENDKIQNYIQKLPKEGFEYLLLQNLKFLQIKDLKMNRISQHFIKIIAKLDNWENYSYVTFAHTLVEKKLYYKFIYNIMLTKKSEFPLYNYFTTKTYLRLYQNMEQFYKYHGFEIPEKFLDLITCKLMQNPVKLPTGNYIVDIETIKHLDSVAYQGNIRLILCPYTREYFAFKQVESCIVLRQEIKRFLEKTGSYGTFILSNPFTSC